MSRAGVRAKRGVRCGRADESASTPFQHLVSRERCSVCVCYHHTLSGAVYSHFTYYNHATTPITLSQYNSLLNFSFLIHLRLNLCCVLSFVVHLFCIDYSILISLSFSEYSSCPIYSSDTVRVKRAKQVSVTLSC